MTLRSPLEKRSAPTVKAGLFLLLMTALMQSPMTPAQAGPSDVFTMANYPVEAHAADAVAAKKRAVSDGEVAALRSLLKRLVPVTAYARLHQLKFEHVDTMMDGISVRSERNSTTDYFANLDFAFRPDLVRALLQRQKIPFVEAQAPAITVVPVWQSDRQPLPGVDKNAWRNAWTSLDTTHSLTPVMVEPLRDGIHPDTIDALAKGDTTMLRTFASVYGGEERIVAAMLVPDPANKKLQVTLVGRDAVGSLAWIKAYPLDIGDPNYAVELASIVSLGVLEGRWKATGARAQGAFREPGMNDADAVDPQASTQSLPAAATGTASGEQLHMAVQFRDMAEWSTITKRLSQVPGVDNIDVAGLSGRSARITLTYPDGLDRLASSAPQFGLTIQQGADGWLLTAR